MIIAVCYVLGAGAGILAGAIRGSGTVGFAAEMLRWFFPLGVGVPLIIAFFGHTFGGEAAAGRLGWPPGNPF